MLPVLSRHAPRRGLRAVSRPFIAHLPQPIRSSISSTRHVSYLPTILQPAFWRSLVPSSLRRRKVEPGAALVRKPWNPATFYIWMSLLIGSQAIQMLSLQRQMIRFSEETDAKIEILREVVRRVQNGEDVDVEALLGTGDAKREKEWEDVMKELESEDQRYNEARKQTQMKAGTSTSPAQ